LIVLNGKYNAFCCIFADEKKIAANLQKVLNNHHFTLKILPKEHRKIFTLQWF